MADNTYPRKCGSSGPCQGGHCCDIPFHSAASPSVTKHARYIFPTHLRGDKFGVVILVKVDDLCGLNFGRQLTTLQASSIKLRREPKLVLRSPLGIKPSKEKCIKRRLW